jgi:DNA-binding YbaB/EbfC family protein
MFGDMMGMMGKLKEAQKKIEETKARLEREIITTSSDDNKIKIEIFKSGKIKDLKITEDLLQDKEELEDYLILTLNKAIEKAKLEYDTALAEVAKDGMPNIPGLT